MSQKPDSSTTIPTAPPATAKAKATTTAPAATSATTSATPPAAQPPGPSSASLDVRRIGAFLLIATAVTTALSLPFATGMLPAETVGLIVPLAQLSPLVAALLVRRRAAGSWWRALALQIPSWRRLVLAAVAGAIAFAAVPMARTLLGLAAGAPLATDIPLLGLLLSVPVVLVMQMAFAIGEEAGWRGWLHQQLAPLGFWPTSAIIGVMWALWHLPIVIALGLSGREAITYLVTIVAVAPLLAAMREVSGTAWAAVIGHGLLNSLRVAIDQNLLGPLDPVLAWSLDALSWGMWVVTAWVLLRVLGAPFRRETGAASLDR